MQGLGDFGALISVRFNQGKQGDHSKMGASAWTGNS